MDWPIEFARPLALLALVVPLWVLWRALRGPRARALFSGTLALWREVEASPSASQRVGRRLPPAARWTVLALLLCCLAAAGPRSAGARGPGRLSILLDTSPSMFLPWAAAGERPGPAAPSRLQRGLAELELRLTAAYRDAPARRWLRVQAGVVEQADGERPPEDWLEAPRAPQPEPPWGAFDRAGTLWLSDGPPVPEARRATALAVGGAAVPGPVAALGRARLEWGADGLTRRESQGRRARVLLAGELPPSLARLLGAWADERDVELLREPPSDGVAELELGVLSGVSAGGPRRAARDGWTWELAGDAGTTAGRSWLADAEGALVAWAAGAIQLAGSGFGEPGGDPAAFAASWSELLDAALLPVPGVVALAERRAARAVGAGALPALQGDDAGERAPERAALLAALGALAAAAAALTGSGRRSRSRPPRRSAA